MIFTQKASVLFVIKHPHSNGIVVYRSEPSIVPLIFELKQYEN